MGNNSQLGWVLAIGGLGIVGFYLFNKQKPTIASEQLSSINKDLATIKKKSEEAPTTSLQVAMGNIGAIDISNIMKTDWTKQDFSNLKLDPLSGLNALIGNTYDIRVQNYDEKIAAEFPLPYPLDNALGLNSKISNPEVDAYLCIKLDVLLRNIILKIDTEQQNVLQKKSGSDQLYVDGLQRRKLTIQALYDNSTCANKIEALKLKETSLLLTKGIIGLENKTVNKSNTDQQIYIGVGALISIVGLYMILKK
jgi:hypothetical protein